MGIPFIHIRKESTIEKPWFGFLYLTFSKGTSQVSGTILLKNFLTLSPNPVVPRTLTSLPRQSFSSYLSDLVTGVRDQSMVLVRKKNRGIKYNGFEQFNQRLKLNERGFLKRNSSSIKGDSRLPTERLWLTKVHLLRRTWIRQGQINLCIFQT